MLVSGLSAEAATGSITVTTGAFVPSSGIGATPAFAKFNGPGVLTGISYDIDLNVTGLAKGENATASSANVTISLGSQLTVFKPAFAGIIGLPLDASATVGPLTVAAISGPPASYSGPDTVWLSRGVGSDPLDGTVFNGGPGLFDTEVGSIISSEWAAYTGAGTMTLPTSFNGTSGFSGAEVSNFTSASTSLAEVTITYFWREDEVTEIPEASTWVAMSPVIGFAAWALRRRAKAAKA